MPLIASHLFFAQRQLAMKVGRPEGGDEFLLGNIVPDIRYITGQSRETTHSPTTSKLISKSPRSISQRAYYLGILFHIGVDQWWRQQIYIPSSSPHIGLAIQLIGEKYAFNHLDRLLMINCLLKASAYPYLSIPEKIVKKWTELVISYLSQKDFSLDQVVQLLGKYKRLSPKESRMLLDLVTNLENEGLASRIITALGKKPLPGNLQIIAQSL